MIKFWMKEIEPNMSTTLVSNHLFLHTEMTNMLAIRFNNVIIDMNLLAKGFVI